jgi:hypothetical protein
VRAGRAGAKRSRHFFPTRRFGVCCVSGKIDGYAGGYGLPDE